MAKLTPISPQTRCSLYGLPACATLSAILPVVVKTNDATSNARVCARVMGSIRPDIAKPSQGPAPLWSQDSGRRLLPGQGGATLGPVDAVAALAPLVTS